MSPFEALVNALAVYRLTRLVIADTFPPSKALRRWLRRKHEKRWLEVTASTTVYHHEQDWLAEMMSCPYCLSVWVAGAVVALALALPAQWYPVAYALALAAVAGKLVDVADHDPPDVVEADQEDLT